MVGGGSRVSVVTMEGMVGGEFEISDLRFEISDLRFQI
jgi:hypothetical protein